MPGRRGGLLDFMGIAVKKTVANIHQSWSKQVIAWDREEKLKQESERT